MAFRYNRAMDIKLDFEDGRVRYGVIGKNSIRLKGEGSYVQTALNGEYTLLTGYVAPSSQFSSSLMAKIIVYGDNDQVLYTSKDIHYNEKAFYFGADVTGQNQIRVEVSLTVDNDWDEPVILMDGLSLYK